MNRTLSALAAAAILAAAPAHLLAQESAGDPVDVAGEHYSTEVTNDAVRALRVSYAPGTISELHSHPGHVAIFLSDATLRMTGANGATSEMTGKRGDTFWAPAGTHTVENIGDTPLDAVLVEIPGAAGDAAMMEVSDEAEMAAAEDAMAPADEMAPADQAGDPVNVAPGQYSVLLENDAVRVLRVDYAPGAASAKHSHPGLIVVNLTDATWKATLPGDVTEDRSMSKDGIAWTPAGTHAMQNTAEENAEVILVEVKGH